MSEGDLNQKSGPRKPAKSERLGAALRENLKRRKEQARARASAGEQQDDGAEKPRRE